MSLLLIKKEIKEVFKSKSTFFYFFILFATIVYSFYSAVDLYSKASIAAIGNPLYAAGFEPVPGVFVPTFGGLFIIFSLLAPFILIKLIGDEKKNNTILFISQSPFSLKSIFLSKVAGGLFLIILSLISMLPLLGFWNYLGGHLPRGELLLLFSGYLLYGFLIISISILSSVIFKTNAQASIFALTLIILSWFLDFGKEMHIFSFLNKISEWTVTKQLKEFEEGILSIQAIFYFLLFSLILLIISYIIFDFNIKKKTIIIIIVFLVFAILFKINVSHQLKIDISESRKNSFKREEVLFLKKLPMIKIKVFLEPTDSRYKDYESDFLKKLKMVKTDILVEFAKGEELRKNYGLFKYTLKDKSETTYSNSSHEIFMILQNLSGIRIEKTSKENPFKGYPLIVKKRWSEIMLILYLIIFPLSILIIQIKKPRRKKNEG